MLGSRKIVLFGLAVSLLAPVSIVACGGSQKEAQSIPKPGDMPEGGDWSGVYYSPTFGNLNLVKDGGNINGRWRNTAGDKWGEMHGEVVGNLFQFEWRERKIGMIGPSATTSGRGYFQYVHKENDEIDGQWGLGTDQTGDTWTAIKQRNVKPDLESVVPDETVRIQGGGWDQKKKPSGGDSADHESDEWN